MRSRFHDDVNSGESPLTPVARFGRERGATGSRMRMGIVMTSLVVAGVRCENRKLPNIRRMNTMSFHIYVWICEWIYSIIVRNDS